MGDRVQEDGVPAALREAALAARRMAHAPYSRFAVGAALLDEHGRVHAGCNVENAAYPQGLCAEAGALAALVLAGGRAVLAVVVAAGPAAGPAVTPCGGCRQKLAEFASPAVPVYGLDAEGGLRLATTLGELLPHAFGAAQLDAEGSAR
jgi:cytidine deaminase